MEAAHAAERLVLGQIHALALARPVAFAQCFEALLRRLNQIQARPAEGTEPAGSLRKRQLLLSLRDVRVSLEQWRAGQPTAHDPAWAWRFVFAQLDEAEQAVS